MHQDRSNSWRAPQVDRELRVRVTVTPVRRIGKPGEEGMDEELEALVGRRPELHELSRS